MDFGDFKPILTSLVLPPGGPLLLMVVGLWLARRARATGLALALVGTVALWLASCNAVAVLASQNLLPQVSALSAAQVTQLRASGVQAIVVLGGGIEMQSAEYGDNQLGAFSYQRMRYGVWLGRQSGLPVAFTGGGFREFGPKASEAEIARRVALHDFGVNLRWVEPDSRDTLENARFTRAMLLHDGVQRVAVVTNAWHMPRAVRDFESAGFTVTPAPMGFVVSRDRALQEWLPSAGGLQASQLVLREWLAAQIYKVLPRQ